MNKEEQREWLARWFGGQGSGFNFHALDWRRIYEFMLKVSDLPYRERLDEIEFRETMRPLMTGGGNAERVQTVYRFGLELLDFEHGRPTVDQ